MKKVAILIPTINRLEFLIRTIEYYVSINSPHPIYIGDASIKSHEDEVLIAAKNSVKVYYFHWEGEGDRRTLQRLAEEANKINNTEFCAYHGDDDFFVPQSLSLCAEFLQENPSYTTAQGRAITITLVQDSPYGDLADLGVYWNRSELIGETSLGRLKEISSNYFTLMFSVHRIIELIEDYSNGIETVKDRSLGEYINTLSIAIRGKSKFIDCLYMARGIHSNNTKSLKDMDMAPLGGRYGRTAFQWITEKGWHQSYSALVDSLSLVLSKNDNLELNDSESEIRKSIERLIYTDNGFNSSITLFLKLKYAELINTNILVKALHKIYRRVRYISIFPDTGFSKRSLMLKNSKYSKDISLIVDACKKIDR
jgi:glycosyltransferase domain-containing protein